MFGVCIYVCMMGAAHENCSRLRETRGLGRINTPAAVGAGGLNSAVTVTDRPAIGKPIRFSLGQSFPFSQTTRLKWYSSQSGDFDDNNGVSLPQSGDFGDNNGVSLSNLLRVSKPISGTH